jgi:SAM-dependent methyltransferase
MLSVFEKDLWNRFAVEKDSRPGIDKILGRYKSGEIRGILEKWVPALGAKKVLKTDLREEASGEDEILFSLSECGLSVFALDISVKMAARADIGQKRRGLKQKYIAADVRNLPFKNNSFDAVVSNSTLDHFFNDTDLVRSLLELKRVLKPGGKAIVTLNNSCNINFYLMLKLEKALGLIPYPVQFYSMHKLRKIMKEAGLVIRDKSYIVHIISPLNSLLLLLRRFVPENAVNRIAESIVYLSGRLGRNKITNPFTGWFIALGCDKKEN